tara:strand:+ start:2904 stop:3212 length:309 start_codon:yes stop_codon:yes gene_type:complete
MFNTEIEIEECYLKIQGKEYSSKLNAEIEVEYTPPSCEVRGRDNSTLEAPSGADVKVCWAKSTIELFNDSGDEIGTLIIKGVDFLESVVDIHEIELKVEDLI